MNTMSIIAGKAAVLAIAAASVAAAQNLVAEVPIGFSANGANLKPGTYKIAPARSVGVITVQDRTGKPLALVNMSIQTRIGERTASNSLRFDSTGAGGYRLAEYCSAGRGCWAVPASNKTAPAKSIEVALSR